MSDRYLGVEVISNWPDLLSSTDVKYFLRVDNSIYGSA